MRTTLLDSPAYQLQASLTPNQYGYQLRFDSFVATARRPETQRRFEGNFSADELLQLRWLIDDVLTACGVRDLAKPVERKLPSKPPHTCSFYGYFQALARQRRIEALTSLAEARSALSFEDMASISDVLHSSLSGYHSESAKLARHIASVLTTTLRGCSPFENSSKPCLPDGAKVLDLDNRGVPDQPQ